MKHHLSDSLSPLTKPPSFVLYAIVRKNNLHVGTYQIWIQKKAALSATVSSAIL